jgi:predicted extracellular nuclease
VTVTVRAFARPLILALIAAMAIAMLPAATVKPVLAATTVWINEIHYDNTGTDADEFVEIAGPAGTDLTGWSIVLYNGSGGAVYDTDPLSGSIPDAGNGFGVAAISYPVNGIQNGSPDGIALVNGTTVVQFLSYEGTFTAVGGPADGMGSTDIGVAEAGTEVLGLSLALTGTGTTYEDFTWNAPAAASKESVNPGQSFGGVEDAPVTATCGGALSAVEGATAVTRQVTASDPDDIVDDIALTSVTPANSEITLGATTPAAAAGGTATATLTVGTSNPGTYQVLITASNDDTTNPQTATCSISVAIIPVRSIGEIQGPVSDTANGLTHRSSFAPPSGTGLGQTVATRGVIVQLTLARTATGARNYGFFLQEPATATDGDPTSSDGIFVFMNIFPTLIGGYAPTVGDEVIISGRVSEFFNLTQLSSASLVKVIRHDVDLAVETPPFVVDPPADNNDANRYWERHEGMQAQLPAGSLVQGGRSVFPSTADAEIYFYRDDYSPLADRADPYARRIFRDPHPLDDIPDVLFDNGNGFRFLIGSLGVKAVANDENLLLMPANTNGVLTNEPAGGIYFAFNKYQIQIAEQPTFSSGADPSLNGAPAAPDREFDWTSATYNVENLYDFRDDPTDGCDFVGNSGCPGVNPPFDYVPSSTADYDAQLTALATQIIEDLKAPDLILTQEGEDQDICSVNTGAMACGGAAAGDGRPDTLQELALRIAFLGGPVYQAANDRDGADDRGIVSGFLFRADRVELLPVAAGDPVLGAETGVVYERPSTPLEYNEDVQNPKALNTDLPDDLQTGSTLDGTNVFTRPPQVGHFRIWRDGIGTSIFIDIWAMSNHFSSTPDGRVFQRTEQAAYLAAIVDAIEADDPGARVIAGGDFNVYPRPDDPFAPGQPIGSSGRVGPSDQLKPLYDQGLSSLWDDLAEEIPAAAYSYVFQGQAQTLDSQFISDDLDAEFEAYRVAHINADFAADFDGDGARGASDHDPSQARYALAVTIARLDALVRYLNDSGELRGNNTTRNLLDRLAKAAAFEAAGKTDAARSQLIAFADQVADFSPRFIDADVAEGLQEEVAVLLGD